MLHYLKQPKINRIISKQYFYFYFRWISYLILPEIGLHVENCIISELTTAHKNHSPYHPQ